MSKEAEKILLISKHITNAHKGIEVATKSLLSATTALLELTEEWQKPKLTVVEKEE